MSERDFLEALEPERYELREEPPYRFSLTRREFLRALGSGLLVLCVAQEAAPQRRLGEGGGPQDISAWIHIGEDGLITAYTGKVELGQHIRTSLSQGVAEELRVPLESVWLVMGDTDLTPFDAGTFGSRTTPTMMPQLRRAAAAARELLVDLAAQRWGVERSSLVVADGKVSHPASGRSLAFGELARGQKLVRRLEDDSLWTPPERWKVLGTSVPPVQGRAIVTGQQKYAADIKRPGMWYGKVLRPPAFGATLASLDTSGAEALGAKVVRDGDFVGVVAPSEHLATQALQAIRAQWRFIPQPSQKELFDFLKRNASGGEPFVQGSLEEGMAAAEVRLEQTYTLAYIAHAPLETRAAVAEWEGDRLTVWTCTQRPFGVRQDLARAFGLPENRVHVIATDTGGAFGGKQTAEAPLEAARLAKAVGRPVLVMWSREEEFTWAYFRPAGVLEVRSGARRDGTLTAWEFHNYNSGAAAIRHVYDIPHQRIVFHPTRSPLRQGSYRSLAAVANHFARETHLDELAHALQMDPLPLRLKNLRDERMRAVLEAAARHFGWSQRRKAREGQGFGLACGFDKGGYVATCAEVQVEPDGQVRVVRVVEAFECGAILNPDHLRNQIEGCIMMGLGGALFEAIEFEEGRILNPRFSRYRVPRFSDMPLIETVLLNRPDLPSAGAGETPIVAIAPAVGNAIFDATGLRLRSLPLAPRPLPRA